MDRERKIIPIAELRRAKGKCTPHPTPASGFPFGPIHFGNPLRWAERAFRNSRLSPTDQPVPFKKPETKEQ